jgi:hypothetical protein
MDLTLRIFATGALIAALVFSLLSFPPVPFAKASSPAPQTSVSVFLNCPSEISFALPESSGTCASGNYSGTYTGPTATPIANLTSEFYLSSFTGGVKVTFSLTDVTSRNLVLSGVGYGNMSGGTCSSPTRVVATRFTPASNAIGSGDQLRVALSVTYTGTGTPAFCSGGANATLISFAASMSGVGNSLLTSLLTPGVPVETTIGSYRGLAQNYTNTGGTTITAIVQGVVKNQAGATVDVLSSSAITLSPGARVTAFLPFNNYPSGSYSVTTIAITISFIPISTAVVAEVSV